VLHTAIFYDADCGFCRASLAAVLAWDRRRALRPVPLQDQPASDLLSPVPQATRMDSWHLLSTGGEVHSAGAAIGPLLRILPGGRPLAALAERWPRAAERAYRAVADRRGALGRLLPRTLIARADRLIARRSLPNLDRGEAFVSDRREKEVT
jgi:predicted DCC family thiol-disulfide oxidoreductase YuxK